MNGRNRAISGRRVMAVVLAMGAVSATAWMTATLVAPPMAYAQAAADHLANAQTLYEQARYAEALTEVNAALETDPSSFRARQLRAAIEAKLAAAPAPATGPTTGPATRPAAKKELLTPSQITHIKVEEMTDAEIAKATGGVPRKDLDTFWKQYIVPDQGVATADNDARLDFEKPTNFPDQLARIRNRNAYSTMDKLHVDTDPAVIMTFVTKVQPYVLQNCATAACHGGKDLMPLPLFQNNSNRGPSKETYTNFYILSTSRTTDGGYVLDRNNPDQSAMIQYMLIPANARAHHPGNVTIAQPFRDIDDPKIQGMMDWMKSLAVPTPTYGIKYNLPQPASVALPTVPMTQPATQPASKPVKK